MPSNLGFSFSSVDTSETRIALPNKSRRHINIRVGGAYDDLPSVYGTFPLVISSEVIEHLPCLANDWQLQRSKVANGRGITATVSSVELLFRIWKRFSLVCLRLNNALVHHGGSTLISLTQGVHPCSGIIGQLNGIDEFSAKCRSIRLLEHSKMTAGHLKYLHTGTVASPT